MSARHDRDRERDDDAAAVSAVTAEGGFLAIVKAWLPRRPWPAPAALNDRAAGGRRIKIMAELCKRPAVFPSRLKTCPFTVRCAEIGYKDPSC